MEAIDFLKNKGITKATCYTDGGGAYYVSELAKLMEEYAALRQPPVSGSLRPLTVQRVDKMLKDISLQTFIACGGNKTEWKEWWSKRNDVNVNSNDR